MSTASMSVCVSINNSEKQRGYTSSNSFEASSDATNSLQSSSLDQRKQLLRDKMAKLLAYDQPAPLSYHSVAHQPVRRNSSHQVLRKLHENSCAYM
ncbi:hypothetical protein BgiBS90_027789 [Biomphalaria glabrata]|nr:hypothetical protein BgiBS90_027789 [Biomphalaria glabrata]